MKPLVVTGTDTEIGKTVVSAMLTLALDGVYWKPIQAGTEDRTDTERVKQLTGLPERHFRAERYVLRRPLSPHRAVNRSALKWGPYQRQGAQRHVAHAWRSCCGLSSGCSSHSRVPHRSQQGPS